MIFWILVAVLTAAITYWVTRPLLKTEQETFEPVSADIAVYKDQLAELRGAPVAVQLNPNIKAGPGVGAGVGPGVGAGMTCFLAGDPGVRFPDHRHQGDEHVLLMQGAFRDEFTGEAGEQPLWDFPPRTLSRREKAAAVLDQVLGFNLVPTTAWRESGPAGPGTVQLWIEGQIDLGVFPPESLPDGWVAVVDAETEDGPVVVAHRTDLATQRMIVFDVLANNADRKGGHLLRDASGLYGIDHGVTFHEDPKLRTVLWGLRREPVPAELLYLTIDSGGPDQRRVEGDEFDLYRVAAAAPYRWHDARVERQRVRWAVVDDESGAEGVAADA